MGRDLAGRTIVVMGGSGNLGRAVVARLASDGATVVAADSHLPDPDAREPGVQHVLVDALDESSLTGALAAISPAPWAVVNLVGGYAPPQPLSELDTLSLIHI